MQRRGDHRGELFRLGAGKKQSERKGADAQAHSGRPQMLGKGFRTPDDENDADKERQYPDSDDDESPRDAASRS